MTQIDATVAICTYNGAARLDAVIQSLAAQRTENRLWEILVVDNASTDHTIEVCKALVRSCPVPLRTVYEERPGLSYARWRAGTEARGGIVCFLDDDNPAGPDFAENAIQFFENHPYAGVIGGKVEPVWEAPPTELALEVCHFALAICDHGDEAFRYEGILGGPVGAGLCIRREALLEAYRDNGWAAGSPGPIGKRRISGSDTALNGVVRKLGWELWYVPSLQINHVIPATRMTFAYLARLYESIGRGQAAARRIVDWKARNCMVATLISLKDFARWLRGRWRGPDRKGLCSSSILARQLHELQLRQVWGRAVHALPLH